MNQDVLVMQVLCERGSITSLEAVTELGVTRLAAVIWKLRHKFGYRIDSVDETGVNRWGKPVRYTRYTLCS